MKKNISTNYAEFEAHYAERLHVMRDPNSSLEVVRRETYDYKGPVPATSVSMEWRKSERFQKYVVIALFDQRVSEALNKVTTSNECRKIWELVRNGGHMREPAILKAISLANCKQALDIYRLTHYGEAGKQALARATRLAKSLNEWWQVAVHAQKCQNLPTWTKAVKAMAKMMK